MFLQIFFKFLLLYFSTNIYRYINVYMVYMYNYIYMYIVHMNMSIYIYIRIHVYMYIYISVCLAQKKLPKCLQNTCKTKFILNKSRICIYIYITEGIKKSPIYTDL